MAINEGAGNDVLRDRAIKRLKKRRDFSAHLLVYVLVNAFLVVIWALTNPRLGSGGERRGKQGWGPPCRTWKPRLARLPSAPRSHVAA